jgi:CheY-like chemotaxis protein
MARKIRILVVDDDPAVLRLLETALTHFGHLPSLCPDGATALEKAVPGAYDLLLLDYRMGSPDGLEVLKRLRQRGLETPVILMSSHFPEDVADRCADDRRTTLLLKPFHLRSLREEIERLLESS